mmetsp:Transcript_56673/g.64689  ORF Transcript_56673/g.64689 Transcript_56673/m.64689 type:complete len:211 (+) Transcript_56673:54-686(+)
MKHNNELTPVHLHKWWQRYVKTWFNQPARKNRRRIARERKAAAAFPRPLESLRPVVRGHTLKYNTKEKTGRGFTLNEIKKAGLSVKFAQSVGIAVDHRRKNHCAETLNLNVQRLESYKSKLILFPRKANNPKKGLINDANTEQLAAPQAKSQNTDRVLFPTKVTSKREKAQAITDDMKSFHAFRHLRYERINKHYHGRRLKRAEEAKEEI